MNVQQLIDKLQEVEDKTLQVRLYTDHGQTCMACNGVAESYISEDVYMPDEIHPDDVGSYDDIIKILVLEGV